MKLTLENTQPCDGELIYTEWAAAMTHEMIADRAIRWTELSPALRSPWIVAATKLRERIETERFGGLQ
jgi:hypothetical protein